MLINMYNNLLIRLWLFVNITLHLLCNWWGSIFHFKSVVNTGLHLVPRLRMSGALPLIPHIHSLCSAVQVYLTSLFIPYSLCFVLLSYIYYVQCLIFDAISKAVSRSMNLDNLQNTVYITAELHLSERMLSGLPIVLFGLALMVDFSWILHN